MDRPVRSEKSLGKIYFLRTARNSENLTQAFDSLSREQFSPEWIDRKGVKRLANEHPGAILIVDSIDSTEFAKIRKICKKANNSIVRGLALRIFTAYALLSINPSRIECLPQSQYPISSTCMKPLRISISGLGPKRTKELSRKLISMGAIFQSRLQRSTRILVSDSWHSTKVEVWRKCDMRLPVVSPEWVERCYEMREDIKDANSVIEKYKLPVFHGMKFCLSGFHSAERTRMHKIFEDNGGSYSPALILPSYKFDGEKTQSRSQVDQSGQSLTTHLVVFKKEGPKYESAMALPPDQIHIVNSDWFTISWGKGYPQMENDPRYSARDPQVMEKLEKERQKALLKKQRAVLSCSLNSDTSFMEAQPNISTTAQEATPVTERIIEEMENLLTLSTLADCAQLFKELSFYICGLTSSQHAIVKKVIHRCCGNIYTFPNPACTHVVIGSNMTSKDALGIKRADENGIIIKVSVDWILRCIQNKTLDIPEYLDRASAKLLGRINSTQDLDPVERQEVARERAEPKASVMSAKFKELEVSSDNRNNNKNANKRGLRIGGTTPHSPFRITKKSRNESIPCSIPVEYHHDS